MPSIFSIKYHPTITLTFAGMRIAVHARLYSAELGATGIFVKEVFSQLAIDHPQVEITIICEHNNFQTVSFPRNVQVVEVPPVSRHWVTRRWWLEVKLPLLIKKLKADVLFQADGICSVTTPVPQIAFVSQLDHLLFPRVVPVNQRKKNKQGISRSMRKAKVVVTVSHYLQQFICRKYKPTLDPLVVGIGASAVFQPLDWEKREEVKEEYAGGVEFFLCVVNMQPQANLLTLLKAFSIFKKWQKTQMKLLIAGGKGWKHQEILDKLNTYKYKDDVKVLGYLSPAKLAPVMASAYAMLYPAFTSGACAPLVEAMQCHVPVIAGRLPAAEEAAGEAGLFADLSLPEELADAMKRIFKDEKLRQLLVENGLLKAQQYKWTASAEKMWGAFQQAVSA